MANPRLEYFLSNVLPDWGEYSDELKTKLLTENADPAQLEKTIFEAAPDFYIREQQQPGYVKQIAGELTGGVGIIEGAMGLPGQVVGSTLEGVGGILELAGMPTLAQMGEDIRVYNTPAYGTETGRFLGGVGTSIGQNVGLLAGAAAAAPLFSNPVTAVPLITAAGMGILAGGQGAHEYLKTRPGEVGGAALYGLARGGAEAAGEALAIPGLTKLMRAPGVGSALGFIGQEVVSELGTEVGNIGIETLANIGETPERAVGDVTTPIATRLGTTALGAAIAAPVIGAAATALSPRIQAAQKRVFDRRVAAETQTLDRLIQEGKATEIKPPDPVAEPTAEPVTIDPEIQRVDIADQLDIIDELVAQGNQTEAQAFMDDLFVSYDPTIVEEVLDKRPMTPVAETPRNVLKPTEEQRDAAYRAATIYESMQEGDEQATKDWAEIPDNVKNTVPYILAAERTKTKPGVGAAHTLLGIEKSTEDEVRFESSMRFATQEEMNRWETEERAEYQDRLRNLRGQKPAPVDLNTATTRTRPSAGDTVTLWAQTTKAPRKPSAVISQNMLTGVRVIEETADGNYRVELPDGNTATVGIDQIVPSSVAGARGIDVVLGPKAPSTYSLITTVKDLLTDAKGWLRMTTNMGMRPEAFGDVSVRASDGRVVRMRLDYALNLTENLFETTLGHEVGHLVSLVDEATRVPGMQKFRPKKGTMLGDLLGEYSVLQEHILTKPFEFAPGTNPAAIYNQQQKFVDNLYAQYEQAGQPMDNKGLTLIQRNWSNIMRQNADTMLTDAEKADARKAARASAQLAQNPDSFKQFYNDAIDQKLRDKGLVQAYMVRREMETVAMRMRGVPDTVANRKLMQKISGREIFADFFSAKTLDVMVENEATGRMVPLVEYYAPAASALFDNYMTRKPATQKFFEKLTTRREDADSIVDDLTERMKKVDEQNAENMRLRSPEEALMMSTLRQKLVNLTMMQLVDRNLPLYWEVESEQGYTAAENLAERFEKLAGISAIATPFMDEAAGTFDAAIQELRKAIPQDAGKAERLLGIYMMYQRILEGGRTGKVTQQLTDVELDEIKEVVTEFEMYSGAFGGKAQAEKVLNEHSLFKKPEVRAALDTALDRFSQLWDRNVIGRIEASGLVSKEQAAVLRKNKHYATYAIERELIGSPSFRAVSPTIKQATGTFQDARNPLGATLEKAISLIWQSYLNEAKVATVDMLGEKWAKPVEKQGSNFPQPADTKNWSLVTLKRDGKDFGYHVPEIFANGLNFQTGSHAQGQFLRMLGSSSNYFRQLYTTWNPKFTGKNAFRDFSRMVMRSIDPTNARGLGLGIIPQYLAALRDTIHGRFNPEVKERLNEEERALYDKALILSGYDFRARDAQDTSAYQNLMRQYLPVFRGADEANLEQSWLGELLGKYTVGRQINRLAGWYTNGMENISRGIERLPKRAAYRYYSKFRDKMSEAEFNQLVRKSGSPYFLNHGAAHPITANVFMFFNPAVQGMYEDLALMRKKPVVAAKYALATTMSLGFSVGGMYALAALGGMGDEARKLLMAVDEDTLDSNIVIPFGSDASGRTNLIALPLDETTAMFVRMTRRVMEMEIGKAIMQGADAVTPNPQPIFHLMQYFGTLMSGHNPINWRGKNAIPQRDFEEGGYYKWRHAMREVWNTASPFTPFYRFSSQSAVEEARAGQEKPSNLVADIAGTVLDIPLIQGFAGFGLLKATNRGIAERSDKLLAGLKSDTAKAARLVEESANAAVRGNKDKLVQLTKAITDLALSGPDRAVAVSAALDKLDTRIKEYLLGGSTDRFMLEFMSRSQAEQLALLEAKWPILLRELQK